MTNIDVDRSLGADAFEQVVHHCRKHITTDVFTSALILSDNAYRAVFRGDVVSRDEFATLLIADNEFSQHSWVRVTGVHPSRISNIPLQNEPAPMKKEPAAPRLDKTPGERSINYSGAVSESQVTGDDNTFYTTPNVNVSDYIGGANTGVQTGTFNGTSTRVKHDNDHYDRALRTPHRSTWCSLR